MSTKRLLITTGGCQRANSFSWELRNKKKTMSLFFLSFTNFSSRLPVIDKGEFFIENFQLINTERLIDLEKHHFSALTEIIDIGNVHKWRLSLTDQSWWKSFYWKVEAGPT